LLQRVDLFRRNFEGKSGGSFFREFEFWRLFFSGHIGIAAEVERRISPGAFSWNDRLLEAIAQEWQTNSVNGAVPVSDRLAARKSPRGLDVHSHRLRIQK
jgi:hypothetical protein